MIYILENIDVLNDDFTLDSREDAMMKLLPLVSHERKKKAFSYHFHEDRLRSVAVYVLLRYGLKKEYGIDEIPEFIYGTMGKPYLKNRRDIYFNFSHCGGVVACIIGDAENGIDVQETFTYEQGIVDMICSCREKVLFHERKDRDRLLNRLWVLKEAYTKCLGTGITVDLKKIDFSEEVFCNSFKMKGGFFQKEECFLRIEDKVGYCMAACSNGEEQAIVYVTIEELFSSLEEES